MAVLDRAPASITATPRVGREVITGRSLATAIPSPGSPASDWAPVGSIAPPVSIAAAASTVGQLFTAQSGSAVSARASDTWAVSAGGNWTIRTIWEPVKFASSVTYRILGLARKSG